MGRRQGERAGIAVDAIVASAYGLLRERGLSAVSMRGVAASLGVAPNALYSHVRDKDALVGLVMDRMLAEVKVPAQGPWEARLIGLLGSTYDVLLEHPDLIPHFLSRQSVGPNALRLGEAMLACIAETELRAEAAVDAMQMLIVYTVGAAAFAAARLGDPDPTERARRGREAAGSLDPADSPYTTASAAAMAVHDGRRVLGLGLGLLLRGLGSSDVRTADGP